MFCSYYYYLMHKEHNVLIVIQRNNYKMNKTLKEFNNNQTNILKLV